MKKEKVLFLVGRARRLHIANFKDSLCKFNLILLLDRDLGPVLCRFFNFFLFCFFVKLGIFLAGFFLGGWMDLEVLIF